MQCSCTRYLGLVQTSHTAPRPCTHPISRGGRERRTLIRVVLGLAARRVVRMQILPPIWRPLPGLRLDLRRLNAAEWKAVARHAVGGVKMAVKSAIQIDERCRNAQKRILKPAKKNFRLGLCRASVRGRTRCTNHLSKRQPLIMDCFDPSSYQQATSKICNGREQAAHKRLSKSTH